jgi:hypothetical protein
LIAQKKPPDALNATQKTPALENVWFLKKSRLTSKNDHVLTKTAKNGYFKGIFFILLATILYKELGFFALRSVHQDASVELSKTAF